VACFLRFFLNGNKGATMIEYALIVALVAILVATSVGSMGVSLQSLYGSIASAPFN